MLKYRVYAINFNTLHFGSGVALAIASNANEAFTYLKTMGRYNATPNEYILIAAVDVSESNICAPTLVYEDVAGVKVIVGPKGDKGNSFPYISLERLRQYLYRVTFDKLPNYNNQDILTLGACSSYVQDGKLYRNLDFYYDNAASFIVRTSDFEGISFITGLNEGELKDGLISQLPYRVVDGRNNYNIKVSTHVLFNDWNWDGCGTKDISLTKLPFLVLTKVKSMDTIASDLEDTLSRLYVPDTMKNSGYLIQLLVTDGTTSYAILPPTSPNQPYVLQDITSNPKLTNFRWVSSSNVDRTQLQLRPTGVERYNLMPCNLEDLRFTKCYENSNRLSEFIGIDNTTKDSTDEELTVIYNKAHNIYLNRERNGVTWHTMHSVVYGDNGMEELYIQENWNDNCIAKGSGDVTKEYVDSEIERVENEIPSLNGYATEEWVEGKGYLTEHQDISGKADISYVDNHHDNSKVNEPTTEGTSGQVLTTDGDGGRYWSTVSGGGGTIDTAMSDSSTNAVQNKVIKAYVDSNGGAINSISVNGVAQPIVNKAVNISISAVGVVCTQAEYNALAPVEGTIYIIKD